MNETALGGNKDRFWRSLRFKVVVAVILLAAIFSGSAAYVLLRVDRRKHDYVILNLSGQLRVTARAMVGQAESYLGAGVHGAGSRQQYLLDLELHESTYDEIIVAFKARELSPKLSGRAEIMRCDWNAVSRSQLDRTALLWDDFRSGLQGAMTEGEREPAEAAAVFIRLRGPGLMAASDELTSAFQIMMEEKLASVGHTIHASLGLAGLVLVLLVIWLDRGALRPLKRAIAGFQRVSQGDLGFQVPIPPTTEVGQMARAFNHLSSRLKALFGLTERINLGTNLAEAVQFVYEEFSPLLPLDWVGVLLRSPSRSRFVLERVHSRLDSTFGVNETFNGPTLMKVFENGRPLSVEELPSYCESHEQDLFACRLARESMRSAVFLPLASSGELEAVLVFASTEERAYSSTHLELLGNIAGQLGHAIEKTVVVEDLVISAVNGLAKLAESRDPETGDHLSRMALYSAAIADQLRRDGRFADELSSDLVREIFRFAPMHDIGKVGVEDAVLLKQGRLDDEERRAMQKHPTIGSEVLRRCEAQMNLRGRTVFRVGIEIAESHHEKYDGSGYPKGLSGEDIPLAARIVAVCDVFDALTSKRPYKRAWSINEAFDQLRKDAGSFFDPVVVNAFFSAESAVLDIYEKYKHV